jgi:hypothetical protein
MHEYILILCVSDISQLVFGRQHTFPHVNQARFGSHLAACVELVKNQLFYIKFLQQIHDAKDTPGFTNIESNAGAAIVDPATLTEMCAAVLHCEFCD